MATFNYSDLFNFYYTSEGIPFTLKNRIIAFPEESNNSLYGIRYVAEDTAWTILSYMLYETIDNWWLLCNLNQSSIFYAEAGTEIKYVLPQYVDDVIQTINEQMVN